MSLLKLRIIALLEIFSLALLTPMVSSAALEDPRTPGHGPQLDRRAARNRPAIRDATGARFTFYEVGLGACGTTNSPNDFVVALNSDEWDGGTHCYATITVSYQGKSAQAQVVDQCSGCPYGGLDMSQGLFSYFADTDEGMIYGDWVFGGAPPPPPPPPPPAATSSPQDQAAPAPAPAPTPSPQALPAAYAKVPQQQTRTDQPALLPTTTRTQVIEQLTVTAPDGSVSTSTSILDMGPNANQTIVLASSTSTELHGATQVLLVSGSVSPANPTNTSSDEQRVTNAGGQPEETADGEENQSSDDGSSESAAFFQAGAQTHNLPFLSAADRTSQTVHFGFIATAVLASVWRQF